MVRLSKLWKVIIVIIVVCISIIPVYLRVSQAPKFSDLNLLSEENAKLAIESNNSMIVFYVALFFTCVIGILELLQLWDPNKEQTMKWLISLLYYLLYFGFIVGIGISISRTWDIMRENYILITSGMLGPDVAAVAAKNPGIFDYFMQHWEIWEILSIMLTVTVFELLFFTKILAVDKKTPAEG